MPRPFRYKPRRRFFKFDFAPIPYLHGIEAERLNARLMAEQGHNLILGLRAWQRRGTWALEAPLGAFTGTFVPGAVMLERDLEERDALLERLRGSFKAYGFDPARDMLMDRRRDEGEDVVFFYRRSALNMFRQWAKVPEIFSALYHFLDAAEKDKSLIKGYHTNKRPVRTIDERPLNPNGRRVRGPAWAEWEDETLRRWFGQDEEGKRRKLTDKDWEILIEKLQRRRARPGIVHRVSQLNMKLKRSLMVDGMLPRDAIPIYKAKMLGERANLPRYRPRLHGNYYSDKDVER